MSDSVGFRFVPFGDESETETLFRDYLGQLLAHLDVTRVRTSCARERALLTVVCGALDKPSVPDPIGGWWNLRNEMFDRLTEVFGWYGDEAELKLWMGLYPHPRDYTSNDELQARHLEAVELHNSDPYSRHEAFWKQCNDQGYDSFMRFWGRHADPFDSVIALIDDAAKVLGDE